MTFTQAIHTGLTKYFDFSGRASRSEYWWFYLFILISFVLGAIADKVLLGNSESKGLIDLAVSLFFVIPSISIAARRFHDRNMSGWWQLISATIVLLPVFWVLLALRGTPGENRFGPDPLNDDSLKGYNMVPPANKAANDETFPTRVIDTPSDKV
tara:strand:- start:143 stop:607 length:465 start_codon:yes stop_codon:yes gene_type:complete